MNSTRACVGDRGARTRGGSRRGPRPDARRSVWRDAGLAALVLGSAWACRSVDSDVHLAPLFSNLSTAGGGREVEALAGAVRVRYARPDGDWRDWALRPLVSHERTLGGESLTRFLVPLGTRRVQGAERTTQLLPIARTQFGVDEHGHTQWKVLALPGILWSHDDSGRTVRAFFPIGGIIERSFTYDRIDFALFPLFLRTQREGRTSWHFLFPVFNVATKPGEPSSLRLWPLFGISRTPSSDRRFWLWPLFHLHRDGLRGRPELARTTWMVFPLLGRSRQKSYRATSFLWPFFGWSRDTESGFWSWDGPWPLVRLQRPGSARDVATRTRVWPFYSRYEGDGLVSTWMAWPIVNTRTERYPDGEREGENVVPFWQRWTRFDLAGRETGTWNKLWPLYQRRSEGPPDDTASNGAPSGAGSRVALGSGRVAFPALSPLWHTPVIDDHYAWLYELYTREWSAERVRERSWAGLWKRERDAFESRTYLSGLWAKRRYREDGARVSETSLLFGLLRWRRRDGHFEGLLRPALPGPGFPVERARTPLEEARP